MVRIQKMLELRQKMQARYQSVLPLPINNKAYAKEDAFIKKIQILLETHLSDENFGVLELCHGLGRSQSQVFKKLKALTGNSIAQYMRLYRMSRARQLLETSELSISEVAYAVGFKDPAYFSRVFSKEFGHSPSEMRK